LSRCAALAAVLLVSACAVDVPDERPSIAPVASFEELPGWSPDGALEAFHAFRAGCALLEKSGTKLPGLFGDRVKSADWNRVCTESAKSTIASDREAAAFFERAFVPWEIKTNGKPGLFTGYYEAEINGSLQKTPRFRYPVHARPDDLVTVPLRRFDADLPAKSISGRVKNGTLIPYPDRAAIHAGGLLEQAEIIAWGDDPADVFFLHIQGSGRISLPDGGVIRVGYAANNGRAYIAIGRTLIANGALARENISMQSIRKWLAANPDKAQRVLNTNPRYIFFRKIVGPGPLGSMGVALTPGHSMAVDPSLIPMGAPVWLDTKQPASDGSFRRLMVAQDTGAAIRGAVRGDIFFGHGKAAADAAGKMKQPGRMFVLLPKAGPETRSARR